MKTAQNHYNELFRIIQGALNLDIAKVRNYTEFLAEKLEEEGNDGIARRIHKLLSESDHELRPADVSMNYHLPVDTESRFPLIEHVVSSSEEPSVVLTDANHDVIHEFISIAKSYSMIDDNHHLADKALSLLLYGPPGTGKSRLARHIASELGLQLYIARLDGLISSYLGSTSKNIRAIFEFASKTPCVLFLDEFDAIAKLRGDTQELGELKRVVNSFIQNLDTVGQQSIVIAATNHQELLDSAIWRRFTYRAFLDYPTVDMRELLWDQFGGFLDLSKREKALIVDLSEGMTGSDVFECCARLYRYARSLDEDIHFAKVFSTLQNLALGNSNSKKIANTIYGLEPEEAAVVLRNRNEKLYSYAMLALLFDVSKATIQRWFNS